MAVSLACTAFKGGALTKQLVEVVRSLAAAAFRAQWQEANAVSLPAPGAAPSPAPASPFDKPESAGGEHRCFGRRHGISPVPPESRPFDQCLRLCYHRSGNDDCVHLPTAGTEKTLPCA